MKTTILLLLAIVPCFAQRPFYAGSKPIGYPEVTSSPLANRNQNNPLPAELNGDREYANRLDKLPIDNQPFWYINRDQYKDMMDNPKTYPQRPSGFTNRITK